MNVRVEEITVEAFDTADYPSDQEYRIEPNAAFCKKFAELIIRECIDVGIKDFYNHSPSIFPATAIKDYFGVEE